MLRLRPFCNRFYRNLPTLVPVCRQPQANGKDSIDRRKRRFVDMLGRSTTTKATAKPVLLLGHPDLRAVCEPCGQEKGALDQQKAELVATLEAFRATHGFGRGIAAPQIGVRRRFIAVNMGDCPRVLSDPVVTWRSDSTFTLYDDCMSIPWLLCAVRRYESISVQFVNESGAVESWNKVDKPLSELLQHELDHLDGVLITDIALPKGIISREEFDRDPDRFREEVDYFIEPTIEE